MDVEKLIEAAKLYGIDPRGSRHLRPPPHQPGVREQGCKEDRAGGTEK